MVRSRGVWVGAEYIFRVHCTLYICPAGGWFDRLWSQDAPDSLHSGLCRGRESREDGGVCVYPGGAAERHY